MEKADEHIRISKDLKLKIQSLKGSMTYNDYINKMMQYFIITEIDPKRSSSVSLNKIEKRIEDVIKIFRVHERDYLKPLLEKESNKSQVELSKLVLENAQLKEKLAKSAGAHTNIDYKDKYERLKELMVLVLESNSKEPIDENYLKVKKSVFKQLVQDLKNDNV